MASRFRHKRNNTSSLISPMKGWSLWVIFTNWGHLFSRLLSLSSLPFPSLSLSFPFLSIPSLPSPPLFLPCLFLLPFSSLFFPSFSLPCPFPSLYFPPLPFLPSSFFPFLFSFLPPFPFLPFSFPALFHHSTSQSLILLWVKVLCISQVSVATHLRCSGIFYDDLIADLLLSLMVRQNWSGFDEVTSKTVVAPFSLTLVSLHHPLVKITLAASITET